LGSDIHLQDDDAEDSNNILDRVLIMTKRLVEQPVKFYAVLMAILIVMAGGMIVYAVDMFKDLPGVFEDIGMLDIQEMETFEHTLDETYYLQEGEPMHYPYDFYHTLELPEEFGEIVVCLIDRVSVTVTWTDEPDEQRGPVSWENQPDTVSASIYETQSAIFEQFDEQSNTRGGEGSIVLNWQGDGEYLEQSWRRNDDHNWEGVDGENYINTRNGQVHWGSNVDGDLLLTVAGDQTHPVLPLGYADGGNSLDITVTLGGRCVSLPPGTYVDPPE
jgi:hypothetical protein